jgi:hypothetical protein
MSSGKHPLNLAKWKFARHRAQSKFRGIGFYFSFEDWYAWWLSHGVDKNVNTNWTGPGRPCMCRTGDTGPYELNNVYFGTNSDNARDRHKNGKVPYFQELKYRWGNQLVSSTFLKQQKANRLERFTIEAYDQNNRKHSETLYKRYYKSNTINYWIYNGQRYQTRAQVTQAVPCTRDQIDRLIRNGTVVKCRGRWDISLEDYVKQNSCFPDPYKVW